MPIKHGQHAVGKFHRSPPRLLDTAVIAPNDLPAEGQEARDEIVDRRARKVGERAAVRADVHSPGAARQQCDRVVAAKEARTAVGVREGVRVLEALSREAVDCQHSLWLMAAAVRESVYGPVCQCRRGRGRAGSCRARGPHPTSGHAGRPPCRPPCARSPTASNTRQ